MTFKSRNIDMIRRIKYLPALFGIKKIKRVHLSRKKINRKDEITNQSNNENESMITNEGEEGMYNDRSGEIGIGENPNTSNNSQE